MRPEMDEDYPMIPRNTSVTGQYWGMELKEAIFFGVNAAILIIFVFSQENDFKGILRMAGAAAYLLSLRYVLSNRIAGRVMYRYVADLYNTMRAKKEHYYFEGRSEDFIGLCDHRYSEGNSGDQEERTGEPFHQ